MNQAIFYTHYVVVTLFLLIYLIKTYLLLSNNTVQLERFTKTTRVPEMIISFLFLATGIYLLIPLIRIGEVNALLIIKIVAVFASIPLAVVGFKKRNKGLALVSFLLIVAAFGLAEASHGKRVHPTAPEETGPVGLTNDGQKIYSDNCSKCHGENGKLGVLGATNLSASTLDVASQTQIVKNGKNGTMPAFNSQLTDQQIDAVVGYVQTLKK